MWWKSWAGSIRKEWGHWALGSLGLPSRTVNPAAFGASSDTMAQLWVWELLVSCISPPPVLSAVSTPRVPAPPYHPLLTLLCFQQQQQLFLPARCTLQKDVWVVGRQVRRGNKKVLLNHLLFFQSVKATEMNKGSCWLIVTIVSGWIARTVTLLSHHLVQRVSLSCFGRGSEDQELIMDCELLIRFQACSGQMWQATPKLKPLADYTEQLQLVVMPQKMKSSHSVTRSSEICLPVKLDVADTFFFFFKFFFWAGWVCAVYFTCIERKGKISVSAESHGLWKPLCAQPVRSALCAIGTGNSKAEGQ